MNKYKSVHMKCVIQLLADSYTRCSRSNYMITSVRASVCTCTSVTGSSGVRRSISVDRHMSQLEGALWSCCHNFITRSEEGQQGHDCSNGRVQVLGRGDRGLAATEFRLNIYDNCTRSRCQANSYVHVGPGKQPIG